MNVQILKLLAKNARMSNKELAVCTGLSEDEVIAEIEEMTSMGLIRACKAVIDWDKLDDGYISAIVDLKVTPKPGYGFEEVAKKVAKYKEVESVYLLSGVYDLSVIVKCRSFQEVSRFVAKELAVMEGITSTQTQFVMRRYKELDVALDVESTDERGVVSSC